MKVSDETAEIFLKLFGKQYILRYDPLKRGRITEAYRDKSPFRIDSTITYRWDGKKIWLKE